VEEVVVSAWDASQVVVVVVLPFNDLVRIWSQQEVEVVVATRAAILQ